MCLANNSERVTQIYPDSFDNEQIDEGLFLNFVAKQHLWKYPTF